MDPLGRYFDLTLSLVIMFILPCLWLTRIESRIADAAVQSVTESYIDGLSSSGVIGDAREQSFRREILTLGGYTAEISVLDESLLTASPQAELLQGTYKLPLGTCFEVSIFLKGEERMVFAGMVMGEL